MTPSCLSAGPREAERTKGQQRSGPRPEVLGGEAAARRLAEVRIDVVRGDVTDLAVVVDVLEQLLAGQLLATLHEAREPAIPEVDLLDLAGLRSKPEVDLGAFHDRVAVLQRRQPE